MTKTPANEIFPKIANLLKNDVIQSTPKYGLLSVKILDHHDRRPKNAKLTRRLTMSPPRALSNKEKRRRSIWTHTSHTLMQNLNFCPKNKFC